MVGLDLAAIPVWGVLGAALVSTLAYASQAIYLLVQHARAQGQPLSRYLLVSRADLRMMQGRLRPVQPEVQA
jgi:hypothetical protein